MTSHPASAYCFANSRPIPRFVPVIRTVFFMWCSLTDYIITFNIFYYISPLKIFKLIRKILLFSSVACLETIAYSHFYTIAHVKKIFGIVFHGFFSPQPGVPTSFTVILARVVTQKNSGSLLS
jgi:hypothetical protein